MDWMAVSALTGLTVALAGAGVFVLRHVRPKVVAVRQFWEHLVGVPANPITGQAQIPGLFERLDNQDAVLETIRHEVEFNNGTSVKDAVTRVEKKINDHLAKQDRED